MKGSIRSNSFEFSVPLHEFCYQWHRLLHEGEVGNHPKARKHFTLFYDVISKETLPHLEKMRNFTNCGVITYDYLWAIFPLGIHVFAYIDERDRIFQAVKARFTEKNTFELEC